MPWLLTCVRLLTACRNRFMSLNEPVRSKANGIVGKPAVPTVAPGGSAEGLTVAVVVPGVVVLPVAEAIAADAPVGAAAEAVPVILIWRRSMWLAEAACWSW